MKNQKIQPTTEKSYDFSAFKVKDLSGKEILFEDTDIIKVMANNLYIAVGDISLMRKIERLYDEKKITLSDEEKERIISLLEKRELPVNSLIKFQFIKTLNS